MSDTSGWQVADSAPRHYQDQVRRFSDPFADALVASSVASGDTVLDVACGTGFATRAAATAAGINGRVIGTDINGPMLELAVAMSIDSGDGLTWQEASALDLPFGDDDFDSVICQQGVQFFPNPSAGLAEMSRVARAGGTVAITVWSALSDSPYLEAMSLMAGEFCGADPSGMALSAEGDQIAAWFADAGIRDPRIERHAASVVLPPLTSFVPDHMKATPWASEFGALSEKSTSEAITFMRNHINERRIDEGGTVPFSSYLATAAV